MEFIFEEVITHPAELVFEIMRDRMNDVIPLVPNVESIQVLERQQQTDGRTRIVNRWQGSPSATPRAIRPFIRPEMNAWLDIALWDEQRRLVDWEFETPAFEGVYTCRGTNFFQDDGTGGTLVRLTGNLSLYPERIPGVPKSLARKLAPSVEKWLINLVSPNLSDAPRAVQQFLDQKA